MFVIQLHYAYRHNVYSYILSYMYVQGSHTSLRSCTWFSARDRVVREGGKQSGMLSRRKSKTSSSKCMWAEYQVGKPGIVQAINECGTLSVNIAHTQVHVYMHVLMRDEKEERKKQARSNKQTKATQHTQGSHFFLRKMSCLGWDMYTYLQTHMYIHTYMQRCRGSATILLEYMYSDLHALYNCCLATFNKCTYTHTCTCLYYLDGISSQTQPL